MKKLSLVLFFLVSAGELLSEMTSVPYLHVVCKPLIMTTLLLHYISSTRVKSRLVMGAIVFSLVGDVLLMDDTYFIPGLISFLTAHVLYIFAYRQFQEPTTSNSLIGVHRVRLAFPIILAGTGLVIVLYPALGALKVPVIVYACVITLMTITAMFRYGRTPQASFWLVFFGAVLFMASDSILAVNRFLIPVAFGGFWIMLTYIAAQFLIIKGLLIHDLSQHDARTPG